MIAKTDQRFFEGDTMVGQGGLVSFEPFFADRKMLGACNVGDAGIAGVDQVFGGIVGAFIIIHHYFERFDLFGDTVEEHDRESFFVQVPEMLDLVGFGRQRYQ